MKNNVYELRKSVMADSIRYLAAFVFVAVASVLLAACTNDNVAGGASGDAGIVAVKDWEVAGVSQKGPFVTGSAVTVQELDGITLKQTGKSFKGTIKSDKGDFAIKDINLQSQYAILEANGYYRDEISGKKSSGQVTLRALTDLKDRKHVNINLLTHLEYERVMYLVTEKKKSIAEAKEQAEREVLATFGIEGDFAESEDLNIFETGDGNAALLAISVLLQSDVDVAGLTERMGEFSISLAEGGSWDDADTKTAIADWACDVDLKGTLANVRKNVESWKYADTVPAFEKFVTNFWWNNYGLGVCNDKRENETKRNVNKLSKLYDEYFVCEKGHWHIPGDEPPASSSSSTLGSSASYSGEPVFGMLTDARDGKVYKTVKLGSQEWMAENLNYAVEGSRCYDNDKKNCEKYGRLYNLEQVLDTTSQAFERGLNNLRLRSDFHPRQGVCPNGWHVPEKAEWDTLFAFAEENGGGEKLESSLLPYDWDDYHEKLNASNKFGFNLIGAGVCHEESGCTGLDTLTYVWTATVVEPEYVMMYSFGGPLTLLFRQKPLPYAYTNMYVTEKHYASIRCVKGEGKKSHNPEKNVVKSSSSGVGSSDSVYNPFDTVPELPAEMAFLDSSYKRMSYASMGEGKQKVWFYSNKTKYSFVESQDSAASEFVKNIGRRGFSYEGAVRNDSARCDYYDDTSYVYVMEKGDVVYKLALTKGAIPSNSNYGFNIKAVVLKDGFKELSTKTSVLPDELFFVDKFLTKPIKPAEEYADGKQTVWRVEGPACGGGCDSFIDELVGDAKENGFVFSGAYSNDSLDNEYTGDSHVYSKTSDGKVYSVVFTKEETVVYNGLTPVPYHSYMYFIKLIVRDANIDEVPTEKKKDYDSPKYREIPEDLKFVVDSTQLMTRAFSNDPKWTVWVRSTLVNYDSTLFDEVLAVADEYAALVTSNGLTLKSKETLTMNELEKKLYNNNTSGWNFGVETTVYTFEKDVEKFRYEILVYAIIEGKSGNLGNRWIECRADIRATIYDK